VEKPDLSHDLMALYKYVYYQGAELATKRKQSIIIEHSLQPSLCVYVCLSLCPVHCGKTADRILMRFGMIGRVGPVMRHVVIIFLRRIIFNLRRVFCPRGSGTKSYRRHC